MKKSYCLAEVISAEGEKALESYEPLLRQLLWGRGVREADAADAFLNPSYDQHLHDPFLMHDMEKAVTRILAAIKTDQPIVIYSDYDCDGIPGGVVLHDFFKLVGYENFSNYIPHRDAEGFGLHLAAVEKMVAAGTKLIITVDCGITDVAPAAYLRDTDTDLIITDHHNPPDILPEAFAIVHPGLAPKGGAAYPFRELCGAGVAFKLALACLARGKETGQFEVKDGMEKWLLDMVGVATVADMVLLQDENRALVHYGLQVLRKSRRPGLQKLFQKARASQQHLTEEDIGFTIGPRVNAASRMDSPEDAFKMLVVDDEREAAAQVDHLERLNNERKGMVAAMTKDLKKRVEKLDTIPPVLVFGNPDWKPALAGLAANSLAETYSRPAFIWGRDGKGNIKGSCRGSDGVSVVELMRMIPDYFSEMGGHDAAGGFGVLPDKIHTLPTALVEAYEAVQSENTGEPVETVVDADLTLDMIDHQFVRMHNSLAPFGMGNHRPLFRFADVVPDSVEVFGKTKEHMKMTFDTKGLAKEAIVFFKTPDAGGWGRKPEASVPCTLIAHLEQSFFMGRLQTRLRIVDIV